MIVTKLLLISHRLCPYVQRAIISLMEKEIAFERVDIDLANKPEWFKAISPLGKTPVLKVDETAIFESAVIVEYLEETQPQAIASTGRIASSGAPLVDGIRFSCFERDRRRLCRAGRNRIHWKSQGAV
jgi:Glutathione S-transferase, N-terminal domain